MKNFMKTMLISSVVSMVSLSPVLADDSAMSYQQKMMSGSGPGYGMGPGYGIGYGNGHSMGPGYGRGMGYGYGMGMFDLNDEQIKQLEQVQTETMKNQRALMRQIWQEQEKMADLSSADKRDPVAIGKVYGKISELQQKALEGRIKIENKMESILDEEQKN